MTPQWKRLLDHVMAVPEQVYEGWSRAEGYNNDNPWGERFGEPGVPWCVIWDWCMYDDVGLAGIVPRVDNVVTFSNWARQRGQWSEYPSIGAWANFGNGHTELVVGFDSANVYTKGGNSVQAGSTDAGQGNGVWSHATARRSSRIVGYFAPVFPDGCPPTADPRDPRGGRPQTSYRWPGPDPAPAPTPVQEDIDMTVTPDELFNWRVPQASLANGYVPNLAELLRGACEANDKVDQLRADLPDIVKSVLSSVLASPMPDFAALPNGYRPSLVEAFNGAKEADSKINQLTAMVQALTTTVNQLATKLASKES
ncbi:hypothetical protein [Kitasatospora sp. NPDC127116]|uniref:hypothetical protein n=1 Tax=Kitasatospora sp. NPDC127116 TaxID=3345367 RepID=UPI00363F342E